MSEIRPIPDGTTLVVMSGGIIGVANGGQVVVSYGGLVELRGKLDVLGSGEIELDSGSTMDVQSGAALDVAGKIDMLSGGEIEISSGADVDVQSGGTITLASGGEVHVASGGLIHVAAGGKFGRLCGATVVVGAEAAHPTHSINVTIQLTDAHGSDLAERTSLLAYLSNDANGDSVITTAPDGNVAIGTDGLCMHLVTDKVFLLTSEADGDIDITLINTGGALTCYLILILPSGVRVASGAITFSA